MFKHRLLVTLLLVLAVVACAPASAQPITQTPPPVASPTPTAVAQSTSASPSQPLSAMEFDAARVFEHNRVLAEQIGSRVAGAEGAARAADYIAAQFSASGFQVTRQPFTFTTWEDRGAQVEQTSPTRQSIAAQAIQQSPGGSAEGQLVHVPGLGETADFAGVDVRGKIALVQRGTIPFSTKAANAEAAGATAILIYNNEPGEMNAALADPVNIPALFISQADGRRLVAQLESGQVQVRVVSNAWSGEKTGTNVVATRPGTGDETIVLGGHYDSVEAGPGANDNASGISVLLELARVMGQKTMPQTLVFVAFDAEELGLYGSRHFVSQLSDQELGQLRAMLNFDMLGGGSGPLLLGGDSSVAQLARSSALQLGIEAHNFTLGSNAGSDHEPFERRGVDTVFFSRNYRLLHTPQDTLDQVREEWLGEAGRVAERVLERLGSTS